MFINSKFLNRNIKLSTLFGSMFGTITHVSTNKKIIALTFDDGPHPDSTPLLLEILERHKVHGTFFLLGVFAKLYPSIIKQIAQAGHAVCNHSWDHPSFPYISGRERRMQIRKCQKVLEPYGKKIFRPPFGDQTFGSHMDTLITGHKVVTWNVSGKDWVWNQPHWYVHHLKKQISPGSIVLMHDTLYQKVGDYDDDNRRNAFQGLDMFLKQIGGIYKCITVPDLLKQGRPKKRLWPKTSDINWLNSLKQKNGSFRYYHYSKER
jgi:peptidoglycan-N-acetylglucosamine deacetylase